jgi:hypothetical protein
MMSALGLREKTLKSCAGILDPINSGGMFPSFIHDKGLLQIRLKQASAKVVKEESSRKSPTAICKWKKCLLD